MLCVISIWVQPPTSPWNGTILCIQLSYCCKIFAVCCNIVLLETYQDHSSSIKVDRKTWPQDMMCSWQFRPTLSPHFVVYMQYCSISQNSIIDEIQRVFFFVPTCLNHKKNTPSQYNLKGYFVEWTILTEGTLN